MGLLGFVQQQNQANQFQQALSATQQGLPPAVLADLQKRAEASLKTNLAGRGLLDSGLLAGGQAEIASNLATASANAQLPLQGTYINALLSQSQQPTVISSLIPLIQQYGLQGFGGNWLIPKPATTTTQ